MRRDGSDRDGGARSPRDRDEAADAIRGLIERIALTAGEKRGSMHAALHGDLVTILEWAGNGRGQGATHTPRSGMSVSVVAGQYLNLLPSGHGPEVSWSSPVASMKRASVMSA